MNKEYNKLKIEVEKCYNELSKKYSNKPFIRDGIVSVEDYEKSNKKVLWVLKEPYDLEEIEKGFSIVENLKNERSKNKKESKTDSLQTWHPIAYVSYGITSNINSFKEMGRIPEVKKINESLLKIGFINIQKFPAQTRSNQKKIIEAFNKPEINQILNKQIEVFNPDIIIEATNLRLLSSKLDKKDFLKTIEGHYVGKSRIYINTFHPAQTKISIEEYVNLILQRVRECLELQNKMKV